VATLCAADPQARPFARDALGLVRSPVADVTQLDVELARAEESIRGRVVRDAGLGEPIVVTAAESWSDALLDALSAARNPWLQTILDREGRTFHLAPWPAECRRLPSQTAKDALLSREHLAFGAEPDSELVAALWARLDASAVIMCPSGERLLALDHVLER
jgi:hypothetical protein